jgi:superfamily II helicase
MRSAKQVGGTIVTTPLDRLAAGNDYPASLVAAATQATALKSLPPEQFPQAVPR